MRLKGLDLNLLIVLDALLKERSVSLAAISLDLGQSAVSSALARLRDHFGDELLTPLNRQMVPTPLALDLQDAVTEWLQGIESIVHAQPDFIPRDSRREFVVLCSDYVAVTFMPKIVRRLADEAPQASLAVRPLNTSPAALSPTENLARRGAHFSILPTDYCEPSQPSARLFNERFCCLAWRGNPHTRAGLTLTLLEQLPHVTLQFGGQSNDPFDARPMAIAGLHRRKPIMVDQFVVAAEMVVGSSYVALVPKRLGEQLARTLPLDVFDLPPEVRASPFSESLQWSDAQLDDPALAWFRDLIIEVAQNH